MLLKAETFIVTSNADSGTGSLRAAILAANANGITATDFITFNLAGTTRTDVSISLATELPILTSNIVIDGTTQPSALLGNPNIKVAIIRVGSGFFNGLRLDNASLIEIYGLSFSNFKADPLGDVDDKKAGVFLYNSRDIVIGEPLKPNCFSNSYAGVLAPFVIPRLDNVNIKISSNIFGLGENGINAQPNDSGIDISFLNNSTIGGSTPLEGNLLGANTRAGIALAGAAEQINVVNNKVGLNINGDQVVSSASTGIYVNGESAAPLIKNNIVAGQLKGIYVYFANGGFKLEGNSVGTGILGTEIFGNKIGIHIHLCNNGAIGGNVIENGNKIAYNLTAVFLEFAYPISILKNSFYCNTGSTLTFSDLPEGKSLIPPKISTISPNLVSGQYLPNSKIELFYTDECVNCEGKTWFATLPTDANGNWVYNGPVIGKVTSMGTNSDGATATFSKPLLINESAVITGVICGESTGSISVDVYDASIFEWYNSSDQLISTSRMLTGVGFGIYYLKAGQKGACDVISQKFTISSANNGINDLQKVITNSSCGLSNGSITNITVANNLARTWYNSLGQVVSNADNLLNVNAGVYYFKVGTGSCEVVSANYVIGNTIITYKATVTNIIPETCGNSNGSVNITAYETQKPDRFEWFDAKGNIISTAENLRNQPAGRYGLIAYGNNGCANTVGEFEILASQLPTLDFSSFRQYISCDGKTISTAGLIVNGSSAPYTYKWEDDVGNTVSTMLNITGVQKGKYTLSLTDKNGCIVIGQTIDFNELISSSLQLPNTISPNGDGINDYWEIKGVQNYPLGAFSIFSRDGNRVYYSIGYTKPFNGLYNGGLLPTGVYYYVIDLKTDCGMQTGSLTIIK
ncbi:gliding motility-associated C-terminal domain-containing protein [Pedobacter cryotolerans]|uniref:gliding motility-associated C-terminal domain-containing protein n=1 Tax=Pedobacter cryotolerans TaxID=2571270 RepID=UPI00145DAB48|nr:gliding motility-associated C-terminal domain-containing protein [Pedobacter cryotolerans]